MHLEGEQAFEFAVLGVVVDEFDGDLAVDLVDQAVALRDDDILMPLGEIDLHGIVFGGEPLGGLVVDDDALAVLHEDAAAALVIDHAVVRRVGMDVALVATDDPLADFRQRLAAILDAGVAGGALHLGAQFEVLHDAVPDEELIVGEMVRSLGLAGDRAVFDGPQLRVAVPAGQGLAVEQRLEAILGGKRGEGRQQERQQGREGVSHEAVVFYALWTPVNGTCSNGGKWR